MASGRISASFAAATVVLLAFESAGSSVVSNGTTVGPNYSRGAPGIRELDRFSL